MQNEPNFPTNPEPNMVHGHANGVDFTQNFHPLCSTLSSEIPQKAHTFTQKYPKKRTLFSTFSKLFIQNKPNFTPNASTKHANGVDFTTNFCLHLLQKDAKIAKKTRFFQLLEQNTLNSMYNKDLYEYSHQNTLHKWSLPAVFGAGKNAKRTQFQPPSEAPKTTSHERRKNAKQTQLQYHHLLAHIAPRATGHGRRVTIKYAKRTQFNNLTQRITSHKKMQNKPNFTQECYPGTLAPIYSFTHLCKTNPIPIPPPLGPHRTTGHGSRATSHD